MTIDEFRQAKQSGVDLYAEQQVQEDAAPETSEEVAEELETSDGMDGAEDEQDAPESGIEAEDDDIPKEQKNAFYKRVQRERKKAYEEAEAKIKQKFESQLNPYKAFFDQIGLDPQRAMEALEQNRVQQEAQRLAEYNGWTEEQTQMYIRQQDLERKQTEMQVGLRIYELADTPDYPGIKQMKGAITDFIRANPRATVEQAYWAVGGQNLAQQLRREAEQREIAKRATAKRTVVSDAPNDTKAPEPLPPEAITFMRRTGMSEQEVRMMMKDEGPKNLEEYRKMKRKG